MFEEEKMSPLSMTLLLFFIFLGCAKNTKIDYCKKEMSGRVQISKGCVEESDCDDNHKNCARTSWK